MLLGLADFPGRISSCPHWLIIFVRFCVQNGDPILILLAFANTHVHASQQWTPRIARRWAIIVFVASLAVETLGTWSGFPFGDYHYTTHFGPLLGLVPLTIPLAWNVVVTNNLFLVRMFLPERSRPVEIAFVALLCTAYDFILEPFATTVHGYWIWAQGSVPWQNYAAWFVISALLVAGFAPRAQTRLPRDPRPWLILGTTLLLFALGRWMGR